MSAGAVGPRLNPAQLALRELMRKTPRHRGNRVKVDGYVFQSGAEAERYRELKSLQAAGEIRKLITHPEYEIMRPQLDPRGVWIHRLTYTADFEYEELLQDGTWLPVTEEVKGKVRYEWHRTKTGKLGKHIAYKGTRTEAYGMRVNLFRRAYPQRVFREIAMA